MGTSTNTSVVIYHNKTIKVKAPSFTLLLFRHVQILQGR